MTIPSEQLGWSNESKLLRDILKKLERFGIIISSGSSQLTSDELAAIQGANSPDAGNPFATMDDISDCCVVVSQTEPTNPTDGLLWYKPDLCETTTTTTTSSLCPEGAIYSGWMTVGTDGDSYGYGYGDGDLEFGSINPPLPACDGGAGITYYGGDLYCFLNIECEGNIVLSIDNINYELPPSGNICEWIGIDKGENPFAPVGELSSICILCGAETTTTTTQPI